MIPRFKFSGFRRKRLSSLLGLTLDGSRFEGVVLRRTNGSLQIQRSFSVSLSLDPLTADAELVGREIRNHLDAAGVRERNCVLGLPLKWALTTHVAVPELPEADEASFLALEAERGFPCDVQTLMVANLSCRSPAGRQQAILVGIAKTQLTALEKALRAAKLKPVSFSLGLNALSRPAGGRDSREGVLALAIGESQVGLQITTGGGVAALRAVDGALESEGGRRVFHADLVAREARITLGQLPPDLRDTVRQLRIFGPRDLAQQLADEMELRLEAMGVKIEVVTRYAPAEFGLQLPSETPVSAALSLAAEKLAGRDTPLEFLPPRVTAWQQVTRRYSSGRLRWTAAAAGSVGVLVAGAFLYQQWQISRLSAQWTAMRLKVEDIKKVRQQTRQFTPWYDDSIRGLTILRQITSAFPEEGVVSAKTIEIHDLSGVSCNGVAKDNQALLRTMERLSASPGVSEFHRANIRGRTPIQFSFDFRWNPPSPGANKKD
jgi:hypothetical protein